MWFVFGKVKHPSAHRIAFVVAGVFVVVGAAWVLVTDILLYHAIRDLTVVARIETAKGWTFVILATGLIYFVTFRSARTITQAQAGFSAVVESIADGVLLLGPDRSIWRANEAAVHMLGAEDLIGMDAQEFSRRFRVSYPDGSLVPPQHYVSQRVFEEGGPLHYKEIIHPENGPELIVSVTAAAVRMQADENPEMVVSVMHDITESEQLSAMRDQFFATAAHELKTPVAVIKTNADALLAGESVSQARRTAGIIGQQCDRIDLLVQNLFVLARIRSESLQLFPEEIELVPLVENVARATSATLQHEVERRYEAHPRVHADEERMALVFRNLLDEAIRSSDREPVAVLVTQRERDATIRVRYRHDGAAAAPFDELGINRLVTTTIVAAHGGQVAQEEGAGGQAVASLTLPAMEDERRAAAQ